MDFHLLESDRYGLLGGSGGSGRGVGSLSTRVPSVRSWGEVPVPSRGREGEWTSTRSRWVRAPGSRADASANDHSMSSASTRYGWSRGARFRRSSNANWKSCTCKAPSGPPSHTSANGLSRSLASSASNAFRSATWTPDHYANIDSNSRRSFIHHRFRSAGYGH